MPEVIVFPRLSRCLPLLAVSLAIGGGVSLAASTDPVLVATVGGDSQPAIVPMLLSDRDGLVYAYDGYLALSVSRDLGATWTALRPPEGPGTVSSASLAPSPGGILDLAAVDAAGELIHARSADAGGTWGPTHRVAPGMRGWYPLVATGGDGVIAVTWLTAEDRNVVSTSTDGGLSFTTPVGVGTGPGFYPQLLTWTGESDLLACGSRNGNDFVCRASHDRGASFSPERWFNVGFPLATPVVSVRGSGDVLMMLLALDSSFSSSDLWTARSADGGGNWSVPEAVLSGLPVGQVYAATDTDGQVWLGVTGDRAGLYTSGDGSTWSQLSPGLSCGLWPYRMVAPRPGNLVSWTQGIGLGAGPAVGSETVSVVVRSTDGGASFQALGSSGQRQAGSPRLVRTDGGRLIAAWLEGSPAGPRALASRSDDDGATWSAATALSDGQVAWSSTLDLVALGGGAAAAWMGVGGGCNDLRVSRSLDGSRFEPSVAVAGATSPSGLSLGADDAGNLALLWRDATAYHTASSHDRGATWSAPAALGAFLETTWDPSRLVRTDDGALAFVAVVGDPLCQWCSTVAYRSEDGGVSWEPSLLELRTGPPFAVEMEAGPGHLAAQTPSYCFPECPNERSLYRSEDGGRSWRSSLAETSVVSQRPLGVDELGNAYYFEWQDLVVRAADGREHRIANALPFDLRAASALVRAPGDLAVLSDRWVWDFEPDVLTFRRVGEGLRRDDSTHSLAVRPDLAAAFPLPEYRFLGAAPGMLDPDETVVGDASRPLVLYGIAEVADNTLWLVKAGQGRVRLSW